MTWYAGLIVNGNGHHRIFKGVGAGASLFTNLRQEENGIAYYLRWGRTHPPLINLGWEEKGIAHLGASPGAPALEETLRFFCDAIWVA